MIFHICLMNSLTYCSEESQTDLYSMCIVSFDIVNIQFQSYFIDLKYQFLKSQPLAKDSGKQQKAIIKDVKVEIKNVSAKEILQRKK